MSGEIRRITDLERELQAKVDALTAERDEFEASNRIRGDEPARLRAQEPVAPPGWREALQFYADRSHFVIADDEAWDTVSGEPSNFWCDDGTATVEDGTVAKMALAGTPLSDEDDDCAAPPAQPAEPVQRLSDERAAFEAWMSDDGQFPKAIERDRNGNYLLSTAANGWRVWQAAIESTLQPRWSNFADPFTYVIQHLNSNPYNLTKDECVQKVRELRELYHAAPKA